MNKIKFSHDYPKLWGQKKAILLAVRPLTYDQLNKDLIEYDTKKDDGTYYALPKTNFIQLVFIGEKHIPFCTIRKHTHQKYEYYYKLIGEVFNIEVGE